MCDGWKKNNLPKLIFMNGASQRLILGKIRTVQGANQNSPFHLGSVCHIARTVTVAIKRGRDSVMLFATTLLLHPRFDININPMQKEGGWGWRGNFPRGLKLFKTLFKISIFTKSVKFRSFICR